MVEIQFNKIKAIQIDWWGDFCPFHEYFVSLGINHRIISPHTHHQIGVVERKHRLIIDEFHSSLQFISLIDHHLHLWIFLIHIFFKLHLIMDFSRLLDVQVFLYLQFSQVGLLFSRMYFSLIFNISQGL